jgi:hypothetical protein
MVRMDANPKIICNYWDLSLNDLGQTLCDVTQSGIKTCVLPISWSLIESDIQHRLQKFLMALAKVKEHYNLEWVITPEIGLDVSYSGLPKDIVLNEDHYARVQHGRCLSINIAPHRIALPSLLSPAIQNRYFTMLSKLEKIFMEAQSAEPILKERCKIVVTGSFYPYYRDYSVSLFGLREERSVHAQAAFRKFIEQEEKDIEKKEYLLKTEGESHPFSRSHDASRISSHFILFQDFLEQSEEFFRLKCEHIMRRRLPWKCVQQVWYCEEADPTLQSTVHHALTSGTKFKSDLMRIKWDRPLVVRSLRQNLIQEYIEPSKIEGNYQGQVLWLRTSTWGGVESQVFDSLVQEVKDYPEIYFKVLAPHQLESLPMESCSEMPVMVWVDPTLCLTHEIYETCLKLAKNGSKIMIFSTITCSEVVQAQLSRLLRSMPLQTSEGETLTYRVGFGSITFIEKISDDQLDHRLCDFLFEERSQAEAESAALRRSHEEVIQAQLGGRLF